MATYFTVRGVRYERTDPDDWEFKEGHEFQRIAGMTVGEGIVAMAKMDTDAFWGLIVVSMQRVDPTVTEHSLDGLKVGEILQSFEEIEPEVEAEPNPQTAPPSNGGESGAAISASTPTPAASGIPHG